MSEKNEQWLVSFDTDRIQDYIFATNSLKEIRGASTILVEIEDNRPDDCKIPETDIATAAGGGGSFFVANHEKANKLVQQIESDFHRQAGNASITAVAVGLEGKRDEVYPQLKRQARNAMQILKAGKAELTQIPLAPYMRPCASCGQLPAEKRFDDDKSGDLLCLTCSLKREKGALKRQRELGYLKKFLEHVKNLPEWSNAEPVDDLNQLGQLDGTGYIGFIKIDGNHIGELFSRIIAPQKDFDFSQTLKERVEKLLFVALTAHGKILKGHFPFQIVLIGGDDLMLFTTAKIAMSVATAIMEGFQNASNELCKAGGLDPGKKPLTMSAGVVICHSGFPIPILAHLGEELLKNAKKKASLEEYKSSVIDFQVVSSSIIDLESARAVSPSLCPYTLPQMEKLLAHAKEFKKADMPSTQLQMIYEACLSNSKTQGTMAALQAVGRMRNLRWRQLLKELFSDSALNELKEGEAAFWPWSRKEKLKDGKPERYFSAFVDLLELYNFIEKGDHDGQSRKAPQQN